MSSDVMERHGLTDAGIAALVGGCHDTPYGVLGCHPCGEGYVVRCFLPGAEGVTLVHRNGRVMADMACLDDAGLFGAMVKTRDGMPPRYAYKAKFSDADKPVRLGESYGAGLLLPQDALDSWCAGTLWDAYNYFGVHEDKQDGIKGIRFALWAPNARRVSVVGDFNNWDGRRNCMRLRHGAGVWEAFVPGASQGDAYKYEIKDADGTLLPLKADPFGRASQHRPDNASVIPGDEKFRWADSRWMKTRADRQEIDDPISVYEIQAGSWMKADGQEYLTYRQLADRLVPYVTEMGFTHVQLMPVSEYPFDGSWGYQPIGLFAPSSRFGSAADFKYFVNACHRAGVGVLFDWVPAHFPLDAHGLARFDGTALFEHEDERQGYHPDWNTGIFNYARNEVRNYLLSNALYWLKEFHLDGIRVDAVSSMLYLDYSREDGEWVPNEHGGNTNLAAVSFLQQLNHEAYAQNPGIMMIAEESTAWPGVSRPTSDGGLGFGFKWNLGWMHDSLGYMQHDPVHRQHHHDEMTFSMVYAYDENFMLSLSHDEVVHGKGSLLDRMPGDAWQKFANLRAYYGFMWAHPGKKLLFMGGEFGQGAEWNFNQSVDWHLLDIHWHKGVQNYVRALNGLYTMLPALYEQDCDPAGFSWLQSHSADVSVFAWLRWDRDRRDPVVTVSNMTPVVRRDYRIGVPEAGEWEVILNSDSAEFAGAGTEIETAPVTMSEGRDNQPVSLSLTLPPLATLYLRKKQG